MKTKKDYSEDLKKYTLNMLDYDLSEVKEEISYYNEDISLLKEGIKGLKDLSEFFIKQKKLISKFEKRLKMMKLRKNLIEVEIQKRASPLNIPHIS